MNKNTGVQKMTNITFTEREELVLNVCLERGWEPNMISFDDLKDAPTLKEISIDSLKGVFGSLCKKNVIRFDEEIKGNEIYTFCFPCCTDEEPEKCFNGYVNTIDKVKKWFAEGKNNLNSWEWA